MAKKLSKAPLTKTSPSVRHEAGVGLKEPSNLTKKQIQSLSGSVEAHIQPRKTKKPR